MTITLLGRCSHCQCDVTSSTIATCEQYLEFERTGLCGECQELIG